MLGYVMPEKPELKIREFELYSGYYCGICKSVERRFGQAPRLTLNYDAVFLALVIASLTPGYEQIQAQRCPVHPLKKRSIVTDEMGIDYAADIMLLLAHFKLLDDQQDEGSLKAKAGLALLSPTYHKLIRAHQEKCDLIQEKLDVLSSLEKEGCTSLDRAAEPFAKLLEEVFLPERYRDDEIRSNGLRHMGYHLGKWIYLMDAYDDLEENADKGTYNPLLNQFGFQKSQETIEQFRWRIKDRVEQNLLIYLAELSKAWETIKTDKNKGILENIIYFGLLRKTEQLLQKGTTNDAESI